MAKFTNNTMWEAIAELIEEAMEREMNLMPNLDWPAGRLYHSLGLEVPLYTPIFVMSRVVGWSAHVIEQLDNNRLIRPRAKYTGPDVRPVKGLAERGKSGRGSLWATYALWHALSGAISFSRSAQPR